MNRLLRIVAGWTTPKRKLGRTAAEDERKSQIPAEVAVVAASQDSSANSDGFQVKLVMRLLLLLMLLLLLSPAGSKPCNLPCNGLRLCPDTSQTSTPDPRAEANCRRLENRKLVVMDALVVVVAAAPAS